MKAFDVVQQLAAALPQVTDKFTDNLAITSLTQVAGVATAVTASAHGLSVGSQTNIANAKVAITLTSLTRSGAIGTAVFSTAHDFTEGFQEEIDIEGATEAEFNGSFAILTVPNRTTVTFAMADSGATTATGSPVVTNGSSELNQYNGLRKVTGVPDSTSFTFAVPSGLHSPAFGSPVARSLPRVSAIVAEELVEEAYTKQAPDNFWAFVVLGDAVASNSREIDSDATSNTQRSQNYRQQVIQNMSIFVVVPSALENAAREARDACEDLFQPICQSVLLKEFDSGLTISKKGPLQFVRHGFAAYNRAWYMHEYAFQQVVDLDFDDTVGYDIDVAFRDIDLQQKHTPGTRVEVMTASINLDEE